jgi:hypothetical protein
MLELSFYTADLESLMLLEGMLNLPFSNVPQKCVKTMDILYTA